MHLLEKILPGNIQKDLSPYRERLNAINDRHRAIQGDSDRALLDHWQKTLHKSLSLSEKMVEVFALVKEVCIRQLGLHPYDVQLLAGMAMVERKLVEMKTGEGKTLAAVFPAILEGISGKGVHIMTFNDYLAGRDAAWLKPVYSFLGISVGYVQDGMSFAQKKDAYSRDVTYGAAKEIGFDFLRDSIAYDPSEIVQRPLHFALIDEADAILIDEARNPLVLAGKLLETSIDPQKMARLARSLQKGIHYEVNDYARNIFLTDPGMIRIEKELGIKNLMAHEAQGLLSGIILALHAKELLARDVDYIVEREKVKLVDEFTGRIVEDRKWRNGLQTAVEAKEGVPVQAEGTIINSISLQHLVQRYQKISGMTATAQSSAEEFKEFYGFDIVVIPPNRPCRRIDRPDIIFSDRKSKYEAILQTVKAKHQTGQPILIGTLTVKESEMLAERLLQEGLPCQVLNAKNHSKEAKIIAEAGRVGRITISTNMAGRGTDIRLGGSDGSEKDAVIRAGGLCVIGTNRHESSRIDRQLKGRAGRQGDVGESRLYISMEDELMIRYQLKESLPKKYRSFPAGSPIEKKVIYKFVDHIQRVMEAQAYSIRRTLLHFSDLVEKQRMILQGERLEVLFSKQAPAERAPQLSLYDQHWAQHLDQLQQLRDGIHLIKLGGQHPVYEFQKQADNRFEQVCLELDQELQDCREHPEDFPVKRPSSTWTYVVSDTEFGDQLAMTLLSNRNIGLQVDVISVFLLFWVGLFRKIFPKKLFKNSC